MFSMLKVNPDILRWARTTAGLTPDEAVKRLNIKDAYGVVAGDRLAALESGEVTPTRPMLVKMAKCYRRPLLTFYLPDIPRRGDRGEDFRTLPDPVGEIEAGLVDAVVRDIRARQALVRASLEESGEARHLNFIGSMARDDGVAAIVSSIEKTLGFNRDIFREKAGPRESFAYLRALTEAVGIFVLLVDNLGSWHTTISVEAFRGFALADDVAPFVAVNANDAPSAWSFTLAHELAHLWIGATGVSGGTGERAIEKFCNDIASEFLLPNSELVDLDITETTQLDDVLVLIAEFSRTRNVSRTMVAYKLHRLGAFSFGRFQELKTAYREAYVAQKAVEKERNAGKNKGLTFHIVRKHRIGTTLIRFVERMMHEGTLSTTKAAKVLGVGSHNVHALIEHGRPNHFS